VPEPELYILHITAIEIGKVEFETILTTFENKKLHGMVNALSKNIH